MAGYLYESVDGLWHNVAEHVIFMYSVFFLIHVSFSVS